MKHFRLGYHIKGLSILLTCIIMGFACQKKPQEEMIVLDIAPNELYEQMSGRSVLQGTSTGENFCWHARVGMNQYVNNYELTKDTEWLDAGIKYYDLLLKKRVSDPDGYLGWFGPYIYDQTYWQDALVGDAILFAGILDFSVLVNEDKNLKKKYGQKAMSYVETAKKDVIEKWDKRGCWYTDGPFGGYIGFNKFMEPGNTSKWIELPSVSRAGISHPFNKQMDVAEVCLRINRITGEEKYWDIAERIYFTAKNRFQYFEDHYCWSYWDPLYPGDVDFGKNTTRHWVGVHQWRSGYQASEVGKIVEAYHYGIVFDETDIRRIINTNLNVMWNKDKLNPIFINSNGFGAEQDTSGLASWKAVYGHGNEFKNQGQLWTGLLDFDQTIRDLYELRFKDDKNSTGYKSYQKRVLANPPSFKRKHAKSKVKIPMVNFTECKDLNLAAVLPYQVPKEGESIIICRSWEGGDLMIDLYTPSGDKVANLHNDKIRPGFFMIKWDGKNPANGNKYKGEYKIRWTINNGYREFPVAI